MAVAGSAGSAWAFLAAQNPPWGPSNYNMSLSSITMACNSSGWFDVGIGAAFGITSFDWRWDALAMGAVVHQAPRRILRWLKFIYLAWP